jgi:hypothetical protein
MINPGLSTLKNINLSSQHPPVSDKGFTEEDKEREREPE